MKYCIDEMERYSPNVGKGFPKGPVILKQVTCFPVSYWDVPEAEKEEPESWVFDNHVEAIRIFEKVLEYKIKYLGPDWTYRKIHEDGQEVTGFFLKDSKSDTDYHTWYRITVLP